VSGSYGDCVVKLPPPPSLGTLWRVSDFYAPYDWEFDENNDKVRAVGLAVCLAGNYAPYD
jgi:hypothetical protein